MTIFDEEESEGFQVIDDKDDSEAYFKMRNEGQLEKKYRLAYETAYKAGKVWSLSYPEFS